MAAAPPDSIRNMQTALTRLQPAATQIATYQGGTRADVPTPPQDNSYSQLGRALSSMSGTMNQATAYTKEISDQQAAAEAVQIAAEMKAKDKTVSRIDEAVKSGAMRAGASPVLQQAVRTHLLASAADKRGQSLQAAYFSDEGAAVRNSNDPAVFNEFVRSHNDSFDLGALRDADGKSVYTDLDLFHAKYTERADQDTNALYRAHLSYRVSENEQQAEDVAGTRTSAVIGSGLDNNLTHAQIATSISSIFRDPVSGLVTHGMKGSKQAEITVDAVVDAAVARRDITVLDMLSTIPTDNPKTFLGGTSYARKKVEAARSHITQEVWLDGERNRTLAERRGAGIATDPETEARAKETRDRYEAEYSVKVKQLAQQSSTLDRAAQAEPEQAIIIQHLASGASAFDHVVVRHMKQLAQVDPTAAQHMMTFVQGQQLKQKSANDEKATLNTYTRLRADLSSDPSSFDRGRIVQESNRGNLTAGQVSSLFENAESASKAAKEFPILQSDIIKQMRTDIRAASLTNPLDEFGAGRLRADSASNEFNDLVLDYVRTHPGAGAYEISKAMRPEVERLARRHNAELDQNMSQTETKAKNDQLHAEQGIAKTTREQSYMNDSIERDTLRGQLSSKYKNKVQLEQVIDQILAKKQQGKK